MIDYERYCRIQDNHHRRQLTVPQIARQLHLDERTVARWLAAEKFQPRRAAPRSSKLDPYKPQIVRWLASHPYRATQIFQRLREGGYPGGITIVKDYLRHIRPPRTPAFLTLAFAPGECAQVDWGQFGSITVGNTCRRLSFFVMVLCYSRMLYVEFTVRETMEHFLAGREWSDFALINPAVRQWLSDVANVRLHGTTKRPPTELFQTERPTLRSLPMHPYDVGILREVRANRQFRVTVDTNAYSVPAEYAGAALTLKLYPDHLCLYHQDQLIARHVRCYDRHRDFEHPDHPRALLQQRRRARDQKRLQRLLALTPRAEAFYRGLAERRLNVLHHVRQIVALAEIYGAEKTARAVEDALEFQAFSGEYIANLLEQRQRVLPEPGALHLTRRQDLLDLELPEPNLGLYEMPENPDPAIGETHESP